MFMASVTVGRAYCTDEGELPNHLCPPPGYDSVVGEVRLRVRDSFYLFQIPKRFISILFRFLGPRRVHM